MSFPLVAPRAVVTGEVMGIRSRRVNVDVGVVEMVDLVQ
jgi:ribosomal protein S1